MLRHIGICILALALLAGPAMAAEADLPPPDPADAIYTITLEADIPNTARCLGDISTALCAVETYIACDRLPEMRSSPVCVKVGFVLPPPPTGEIKHMLESRPKDSTIYRMAVFYRVQGALWPPADMVAAFKERASDAEWIMPGDGVILIRSGACIVGPNQECRPSFSGYRMYSLRRVGSFWRVNGESAVPNSPTIRQALNFPG